MILQAVFTKISRAFDENENEREKKEKNVIFPYIKGCIQEQLTEGMVLCLYLNSVPNEAR